MGYITSYLFGKLVNVEPRVSKEGQLLIIRSGFRAHLFSLGAASRKITVDPVSKIVRLRGRRFWFFTWSRRIQFDWIDHIEYGYWSTDNGWWGEYTANEMFIVALLLKDSSRVVLCRFYGSGDFVNNTILPDWCYWADEMVANASRGTQESSSYALVDVLEKLIGVPVVNPQP